MARSTRRKLYGRSALGGHDAQQDDYGDPLLIDSHNQPVVDPVWDFYESLMKRAGPIPTLIEWDNYVPSWSILANEARLADNILRHQDKAVYFFAKQFFQGAV